MWSMLTSCRVMAGDFQGDQVIPGVYPSMFFSFLFLVSDFSVRHLDDVYDLNEPWFPPCVFFLMMIYDIYIYTLSMRKPTMSEWFIGPI